MDLIQAIENGATRLREDEEYVRRSEEGQGPFPDFPIRGSAIGKCPRELAMLLRGSEPRPFSPRARRIFDLGHQRGESLATALAAEMELAGYSCQPEAEIWTPLPIHSKDTALAIFNKVAAKYGWKDSEGHRGNVPFKNPERGSVAGQSLKWHMPTKSRTPAWLSIRSRADLLCRPTDMADRPIIIVEFKTANAFKIKKLPDEGPGDAYVLQVLNQMQGVKQAMGAHAAAIWGPDKIQAHMVYENKDDCSLHTLEIPFELDVLWQRLQGLATILQDWLNETGPALTPAKMLEDNPPSAKTGKLPWQCDYCSVGPIAGNCLPGTEIAMKEVKGVPKHYATL